MNNYLGFFCSWKLNNRAYYHRDAGTKHSILRHSQWCAEWGRIMYLLEIFPSPHFRGRISAVLPLHINIVC